MMASRGQQDVRRGDRETITRSPKVTLETSVTSELPPLSASHQSQRPGCSPHLARARRSPGLVASAVATGRVCRLRPLPGSAPPRLRPPPAAPEVPSGRPRADSRAAPGGGGQCELSPLPSRCERQTRGSVSPARDPAAPTATAATRPPAAGALMPLWGDGVPTSVAKQSPSVKDSLFPAPSFHSGTDLETCRLRGWTPCLRTNSYRTFVA